MLLLLACTAPEPAAGPTWFDPTPVTTLGPVHVPATGLVINEVMTANDSVVMTPDLEFADWVELLNTGVDPVDLARVSLSDGTASWSGAGTLRPGARLLVWATGEAGPTRLPFALDADGDELTLSVDGVAVDRIATGAMPRDTAWARFPDGEGAWLPTARPTPDAPNGNRPSDSLDPSDPFFVTDVVHPIDLVLGEAEITSLGADPYTQVQGSLGVAGAWFGAVGVSVKGVYGSLRSMERKFAFKVDLNDIDDHHFRGMEHLTFNNMVQDPSCVHEAVSYAFLREMGIPAPRTGWARVALNGEDRGFYLWIEAPDDHFLARWYDDPSGQLWEGAYGVDLQEDEIADLQYDSGPDVPDTTRLYAVSAILDGTPDDAAIAALERYIALDQWLAVMAFEAIAYHWDGYSTANNYRIYEDPVSERIYMLPWGIDQTWADAYLGPWGGYGRVFTFCLANTACRVRYDELLVTWADAVEAADLPGRVEILAPFVREQLETDPLYETSLDGFDAELEATLTIMRDHPAEVREAALAELAAIGE